MEIYLSITASPTTMKTLVELARSNAGEASEPEALSAESAFNAGLDIETLKTVLEVATLMFNTGATAITFLKALRDYLRAKAPENSVVVARGEGEPGTVTGDTSDAELAQLAGG